MTFDALSRRDARPPLKSPLPQKRDAARPKMTVASAWLMEVSPQERVAVVGMKKSSQNVSRRGGCRMEPIAYIVIIPPGDPYPLLPFSQLQSSTPTDYPQYFLTCYDNNAISPTRAIDKFFIGEDGMAQQT